MKIPVKPPYPVAAILSGRCSSPDETIIVSAVDKLMRDIRSLELMNPSLSQAERNEMLQTHIEAAYEYYGSFSAADMAAMLITDRLLSKEVEDND